MSREVRPGSSPRMTRRRLLGSGAAGLAGLAVPVSARASDRAPASRVRNCIFILCTGAPPQHETWDPKPEAPEGVRGPYGAIATSADGVRISSLLPRLARLAHRYALVRSVYHPGPLIHETGLQLAQTGALFGTGPERPHFGAVVAALAGGREGMPASVLLPRPLGSTGVPLPRGEGAGVLGASCDFCCPPADAGPEAAPPALRRALDLDGEPERTRESYGKGEFGRSCLRARRLVERGVRFVAVNQFDTLFHAPSWDCHGYPDLPTRVADLHREVAPSFDRAVSALIRELDERGLFEETLVCCFGEFGRGPEITPRGGREHHSGCWSVMLGGAGIRGGTVVGASDALGAEPREAPATPAMLAATVYRALGIPLDTLLPAPDGCSVPLLEAGAGPISALF